MSGRIRPANFAMSLAAMVVIGMIAPVDGANAARLKVLYSFPGGADGALPGVSFRDRSGNLYGATGYGGTSCDCGTVFKLAPDGTETVLYAFAGGTDGTYPSGVIRDSQGNLYGTTYEGGNTGCGGSGCGTVFKIVPDGTKTILHTFAGGTDGANPVGVIQVGKYLYGITAQGGIKNCGPYNCGTVFRLDTHGKEHILHRFAGGRDGSYPAGVIADSAGNLYGATVLGGGSGCSGSGCGTVFKLAPDGSETVLHAFTAGNDGSGPDSELTLDASGNLYGTTAVGGSKNCQGYGCGTVYKVSADGTEQVLYAFQGTSDGSWPWGNLILDGAGNLYGVTDVGAGVVFKLAPGGTESVLHAFTGGNDGDQPNGLVADNKGNLYGTALYGGTDGDGTVFKLKE